MAISEIFKKLACGNSNLFESPAYAEFWKIGRAMIHSFANTATKTEQIWNGLTSKRIPADVASRALDNLKILNRAKTMDDLRNPPSNRLHALKDDRKGQFSISINKQWRICFVWKDGNAYDVEICDYH